MPIYGAVLQAECCQEAFPVLENSKCEERGGVDGLHLVLLERKVTNLGLHFALITCTHSEIR